MNNQVKARMDADAVLYFFLAEEVGEREIDDVRLDEILIRAEAGEHLEVADVEYAFEAIALMAKKD